MVPDKKDKRLIRINSGDISPGENSERGHTPAEEGEIPSALERALGNAEIAENKVLKRKIEELEGKVASLEEELNRERAKVQNIRRRADEDISEARKYGAYDLAFDLLNILDCLEMGMNCHIEVPPEVLKPYIEGVDYTVQELLRALRRNGIEEVPTDIPYDPNLHQVFECIENSGHEPGTILEVKRKGYIYRDRVLRTALVSIAGSQSECPGEHEKGDGPPGEG